MTTPAQPRTPDRDSPAFAGPYAPGQPMPSDEQITAYLEMESYMARALAHTTDGSSIEERTAIAVRFVRAAIAEPGGKAEEADESAWVIENIDANPNPRYWTGASSEALRWSHPGDHLVAIRFARMRDAAYMAQYAGLTNYRVCEHIWTDPPTRVPAQPEGDDPCEVCGYSAHATSAETGRGLYCVVCDARSRSRDFQTERDEARAALTTLRTLAGELCETFGKAMDAHRLHRHLGFMCQCGPCGASYAAHARLSAHLGEKATSQCCPRDHDHDGNCDRHPAPRVGVDPSVPNPAIVVPPQPEAATGERPPPTVETAEGWRSKCKVHTAKDGTRYVKEPGGLLLQVGSRQWEGTNADAYFPSERAARAALAKAPPPPGVEPAPDPLEAEDTACIREHREDSRVVLMYDDDYSDTPRRWPWVSYTDPTRIAETREEATLRNVAIRRPRLYVRDDAEWRSIPLVVLPTRVDEQTAPTVTLPLADAQSLLRAIDAWGLVLKSAIVLREAIERAKP